MPDCFAVLGLECSPVVDVEAVERAYARQAREVHPDRVGGSGEGMAELNLARKTLTQPALRIAHYLELRGYPLVERGVIPEVVGALFGEVASGLNRARSAVEKRASAASSIARAVAEGEVREAARVVNGLEARVREQAGVLEAGVREWAVAGNREFGELDALRRAFAFIARWQGQLAEVRAVLGGATGGA